MEGDSFNKTFGTVKGREGFSAADAYVKRAERKGGRVIHADTVAAGRKFMLDDLKMRGIQFGNSVTDEERQHHLKMAAESFADLADVTGLSDADVSLNGQLAIAFGARGKGNALAHYEPSLRVINLTRKKGVGSLAHEWGHFFDNMMAREQGGKDSSYLSSGTNYSKPDSHKDELRRSFAELNEAFKPFRQRLANHVRENAKQLVLSEDRQRYWQSTEEVFARSFEKHVQHKLGEKGQQNTYLAGFNKQGLSPAAAGLWPTEEETKAMAPAFDAIFAAYRKRQSPATKGG